MASTIDSFLQILKIEKFKSSSEEDRIGAITLPLSSTLCLKCKILPLLKMQNLKKILKWDMSYAIITTYSA